MQGSQCLQHAEAQSVNHNLTIISSPDARRSRRAVVSVFDPRKLHSSGFLSFVGTHHAWGTGTGSKPPSSVFFCFHTAD